MATLSSIITPTNVETASSTSTLTNKTIDGDNNTITNIDLAGDVKGTLPVANGGTGATSLSAAGILTTAAAVTVAQGGTGATSLTANNVILGNGTSAVQVVAPGTSGNVLTSNGTTWQSTAPAGGGAMVLLAEVNASSSSTVEFSGYFSSTYNRYAILFDDVKGSVGGWNFYVQLYLNGYYVNSGYRYYYAKFKEGSAYDYQSSSSNTQIWIADALQNHSNSPNASGSIEIHKPFLSDGNDVKTLSWRVSGGMSSQEYVGTTVGSSSIGYNYAYPVTKIKLYPSTGNFSKGSFCLYGIKKN